MTDINESSVLIEFFKKAAQMTSYSELALKYNIEQGTQRAAQLSDSIESLRMKEFIEDRPQNAPLTFMLTSLGVQEAIKLFTFEDLEYPLNKYERDIINYSIKKLNVWNGQISLDSNIQQYLFKVVGIFEARELKKILYKKVYDYLYENDFIEPWENFYSVFRFKYSKGEQLHRAGTIEKYWKKEAVSQENNNYHINGEKDRRSKNYRPTQQVDSYAKENELVAGKEGSPVVFISYSWDDESHKNWVIYLADRLLKDGIDVLLDVYELRAGKNVAYFIENAIQKSNRIIIIFTPNYKLKADNRKGGVGYEYSIINTGLYKNIATNEKIIPILRQGDIDISIPNFMQQFIHIDFSNDWNFEHNYTELIREIYNEPKRKKGILGQKPDFNIINPQNAMNVFEKGNNIFVEFPDKSTKQLTFSKADSEPFLLLDENAIIFIRNLYLPSHIINTPGDFGKPLAKKLMKVNCNNLFETTITSKKSYIDGQIGTEFICGITNPTLSVDQKYIYFLTEAYATSDNLIRVDLENGNWEIISDALEFELIKTGTYQNLILIGKSQIKDRGRDVYYYLINEKNQTLKEFESKENCIEFRNNISNSS